MYENLMKKEEKAITLIALAVTIIVLLILAGISIGMMIGENGIITRAIKAKEVTEMGAEKEKIDFLIQEYAMEPKEENKLGIALHDKTLENSAIWDIIKTEDTIYGTGWNYIEKGTNINNYGITEYNWVIDYERGKVVKLEDNKYSRIKNGENMGTTEGLIFNLDPSIIEETNVEDLKNGNYEVLWKNTELLNFDWNEESGLTSKAFKFDGVNDYIKVKYDKQEEKETLANNGFTFEFYGTIENGMSYDINGDMSESSYAGMFCYWNGNEKGRADFRFGKHSRYIKWNAGWRKELSDFSEVGYNWNIVYPINDYKAGDDIYITITLDTSKSYIKDGVEYYKQIMYLDGRKLYEGGYNKANWDAFVSDNLNDLNTFCIGRSPMTNLGEWHYAKLNAYALRLYNHALTTEETEENYKKTKEYYELIK